MDSRLYSKEIQCPVCSKNFTITKVKSTARKVESVDSDFCIHYKEINPVHYDVIVCDHCGYAALMDKFNSITYKEVKLIQDNISSKWVKRSFAGERTVETAIEAYKLALLNLYVRNSKSSELVKICIRIAWLYREMGSPKENEFLEFSLRHYTNTYENEKFPVDKLDEYTCMYMVGELNRKLGHLDEAVKWFSRIISSPEARANKSLMDKTRDQYMNIKDELELVRAQASS